MGQYTPAILVTLAIIIVMVALIALGWRNRLRRQSDIAAPPATPENPGVLIAEPSEGQYVSTTRAGDWLDRIAAHQLGIRSNATLFIHADGVLLARHGASDVFIPAATITSVTRASGMAGKFVEKDGLLVITWALGETAVDTGFRPRYHQELPVLLAGIAALGTTGSSNTPSNTPGKTPGSTSENDQETPPAEDKENQ